MIVVSDTSPINYLGLIGHLDLLPLLYQEVIIPSAVQLELEDADAPPMIRRFMDQRPHWLIVRHLHGPMRPLGDVDEGEHEAILLATEIGAHEILIDDQKGRVAALHEGLKVVGTLGVLIAAADRELIHFPTAYRSLRETNFRMSNRMEGTVRSIFPEI
jgi:predicted nucleic acid-binding protein